MMPLRASAKRTASVAFAVVEAERLLIEVAEQMERFDATRRCLDGALQEAPEVFQPLVWTCPST